MARSSARWSVGQLLLSWVATWAATAVIKLGPALAAGWRAANGPEGQGNISLGFNGSVLHASVTERGAESWAGSASVLVLALWIALPPLALWAAWMFANARSHGRDSIPPAELGEGMDDALKQTSRSSPGLDVSDVTHT